MTDFLLELLCEEIPARMQAKACDDLATLFTAHLAAAGLKPEKLTSYVTPRRLALIAHGLPLQTEAVSEEHKGPRTSAPDQALEGFLRKTGLTKDQLEDRDGVYFAVVNKPGRATADVLATAIPAIIRAFPWPKSMRWGGASATTESLRWVRPLQGVIALLGEDVVPCEVDGIGSGTTTVGHRFHSSGAVTITSAADYADKLRAAHVIVDQAERQAIITEKANAAATAAGLTLVEDRGLVAENAGLTEWPVPLLGHFDPAFLDVPPEVIQLTLRTNQKYFVLRDGAGKLAPAFICTANIEASDGGAAIVAGNGKVLAARLSDARFFWEQDKKTALAVHAEKLGRITFHEKLGTVADKVERVAKLARWLVEQGIVKGASAEEAELAARLCKADLVTEMVGEFPELQGLMGGYYARAEGLPDTVADAIRDHYKPVGQGDDVPTAPVTVTVSLADKADTLASFFSEGMRPTGSKDPFALRRAALGILNTIYGARLRVDLMQIFAGASIAGSKTFLLDQELVTFLEDRLSVALRAEGIRPDIVKATLFWNGDEDIVCLTSKMHALQSFITTEDGKNLLAGYKRAANILKKEALDAAIAPAPYSEPAEIALSQALDTAEPLAAVAIEAERFEDAMAALATLRAPIDAFFETVIVNDDDPTKRATRLTLLERVSVAVHKVADFSKIEG
jgi:glycyl-tRNA synthetase beta chain